MQFQYLSKITWRNVIGVGRAFYVSKHLDQASSQWKIDSRQDGERFSTIENQFVWGKNRIWQSECRLFICRGLKFLINLTPGPIWLGIERERKRREKKKERKRERMRIYISSYIYYLSIQVLLFSFTLNNFKNSYFSSN